jgi:hypothetical protein
VSTARDLNKMLAEDMGRFYADPKGFVQYAFPWGSGELVGRGLEQWQADALDDIGRQVAERGFDGFNPVSPVQVSVVSGHGVGKSTLTAWITLWILSTRPYSVGTITSNTNQQLENKTWAQIRKWHRLCVTQHWFRTTSGKGSMAIRHVTHPEDWFAAGHTCAKENSEAFQGQHAVNSTSFYIMDEASAIPKEIFDAAQGGLTDGEPMMFLFGNPTRNTGFFHETFHRHRKHWTNVVVDSRDVSITNKKLLDRWIKAYGFDSDFVRVRVRGVFPRSSALQFIGTDLVNAARGRAVSPMMYIEAPRILGVDIARSGDDSTVLIKRQGRAAYGIQDFADLRTGQIVGAITDVITDWDPDMIFLDMGNIGAAIYDILVDQGHNRIVQGVWFGGGSTLQQCKNKRVDMWWRMRDWLRGGSIPDHDQLCDDLVGPETLPDDMGIVRLEPKEAMKKRGLASPDFGDALALTFAGVVSPKRPQSEIISPQRAGGRRLGRARRDTSKYDPLGHINK